MEECYQLFEDLCTINEIQAIAQRMEVAAMLDAKRTYVEIAEKNRRIHSNHQPVSIVACITARMAISWRLTV